MEQILFDNGKIFLPQLVLTESSVHERLQSIPANDLHDINTLFRALFFRSGFAYTCFGDKAVSSECFDLHEEADELDHSSPFALNAWKRHAHLFPLYRFVFLFYDNIEEGSSEISLINKIAFKQVFQAHRSEFATLFGPRISAETLLSLLIEKGSMWNTPLKDREDLIGILLGYGKINADLYQKRAEIRGKKMTLTHLQKVRLSPSQAYETIDEELSYLKAHAMRIFYCTQSHCPLLQLISSIWRRSGW